MTKEELYLKTIFCCIACDGNIATEEVDMVEICVQKTEFSTIWILKSTSTHGLQKSMNKVVRFYKHILKR